MCGGIKQKKGAQPKIMIRLKDPTGSGKVSLQPKVKWNAKVKEANKTVIKAFSISKLKLDSASVTFSLSSNELLGNKVKGPDGTQIGILRKATKEEMGPKKSFTYVIEGNADTLKNADISETVGLFVGGGKIDPLYYTVKVSNTGKGKIGSITFKADKNSPYKDSRTIKFMYK